MTWEDIIYGDCGYETKFRFISDVEDVSSFTTVAYYSNLFTIT